MRILHTALFKASLKDLRASSTDIRKLENHIAADPWRGDIIPGMNGLRKIRFPLAGRGARGGGRAIYFVLIEEDTAVLLFAYSKKQQEDMSPAQKKSILALLKEIRA